MMMFVTLFQSNGSQILILMKPEFINKENHFLDLKINASKSFTSDILDKYLEFLFKVNTFIQLIYCLHKIVFKNILLKEAHPF